MRLLATGRGRFLLLSSSVMVLSVCPHATMGILLSSFLQQPSFLRPSSSSSSSSSSTSWKPSSSSRTINRNNGGVRNYGSTTSPNLEGTVGSDLGNLTGGGGVDNTAISHGKNRGMAVALFASYFTVMAAKCALPCTLAFLTGPRSGLDTTTMARWVSRTTNAASQTAAGGTSTITPNQLMAATLSISTLSITLGKTLLGPIIDSYSGTTSLKAALVTLALALATVASTTHFHIFALAWISVDFIFSACWAACLNAVHWEFGEEWWPDLIGMLAVAARAGNATSFLAFAWVLGMVKGGVGGGGVGQGNGQAWRPVFWISALIQLVPLVLLTMFGTTKVAREGLVNENSHLLRNNSPTAPSKNDPAPIPPTQTAPHSFRSSLLILRNEAKTFPFWTHFIARSTLMIIASFLLFVPSYMSTAYSLSASASTRVGSIYALGCLLAVKLGSRRFARCGVRGQIWGVLGLLGVTAGCCVSQMLHCVGGVGGGTWVWKCPVWGGVLAMFLWGCSFSIPFYIPGSLYALQKGGRRSSATIADAFDLGGYTLLAMFNGFVVDRQTEEVAAWYLPFKILLGCTLVAMVSLPAALYFDDRSDRET